jgi:hypothetical protein
MTKEKIQELLLEPFELLSEDERAQIEAYAEKDTDIRRALDEARKFSAVLGQAQIMRDPGPATWNNFVPKVRSRIEKRTVRTPLWFRRPVLVPVMAVALLAGILITGKFAPNFSRDYTAVKTEDAAVSLELIADGPVLMEDDYESLSQLGMDVTSVASILEVDDIKEASDGVVPENELDASPLMDEITALPESDIEELLTELEATQFM